MYAIPNLFLPMFAGVIFDKIGARNGLLFFSLLLMTGQAIMMIAGYKMDWSLLLIGRLVYGCGCESMYVG